MEWFNIHQFWQQELSATVEWISWQDFCAHPRPPFIPSIGHLTSTETHTHNAAWLVGLPTNDPSNVANYNAFVLFIINCSVQPNLLWWYRQDVFVTGAAAAVDAITVPVPFDIHGVRTRTRRSGSGKLVTIYFQLQLWLKSSFVPGMNWTHFNWKSNERDIDSSATRVKDEWTTCIRMLFVVLQIVLRKNNNNRDEYLATGAGAKRH